MQIVPAEHARTARGPSDWFTGDVWIESVAEPEPPTRLQAARVSFAARARTAWHTHPLGQTLLILQGICRAQTDGGQVQTLSAGDVVRFAPGERHWHGAGPDAPMVHLALQEADGGAAAAWAEHVTDAQYGV
jgi:quercetin dioxygenase-like cupin family protein